MRVSIIISTKNRCAALQQTLVSLSHVDRPANTEVDLIVVDNGSSDATSSIVAGTQTGAIARSYLLEKAGGKSIALNSALTHAKGEVIVLIDDDVIPAKNWLPEIIRPIVSGGADAVAGAVAIAPHLLRPWMKRIHRAWLASTENLGSPSPETLIGANMAIHRRVLEGVPEFDPELGPGRLGLWEDTLFGLQLQQAGFTLRSAPEAKVEHHFLPDRLLRAAFLNRAKAEARSSAYVAWHWRHQDPWLSGAALWRLHLLLWAKRIVRWRDWHQLEGMPEWELYLLTGIEQARRMRHESLKPRSYAQFGLRRLMRSIP